MAAADHLAALWISQDFIKEQPFFLVETNPEILVFVHVPDLGYYFLLQVRYVLNFIINVA